jgi:flagellar basal-body rod protein FlgF
MSIWATGQAANSLVALDRLRLVKPDNDQLVRGEDTLFRTRDGIEASADASVSTTSGALEASNVKAVDAMVRMLEYARHYETQVKMMKLSSENDQASARLMRMSGKFYLIRPLLVTPGHHLHP